MFFSGDGKGYAVRMLGANAFVMPTFSNNPKRSMGREGSVFLDSGAFALSKRAKAFDKKNPFAFFNTKQFWRYQDDYANFVRENSEKIDLYANVDVIPNPDLTWRNQRYLEEEHGLMPVPVVHFGTNVRWLDHYLEHGHKLIGLGGLVGRTSSKACQDWIDRCFQMVCDTPNKEPRVKIHGFGVTSFTLLRRYPFASVDSSSWTKTAAFGRIYVPQTTNCEFDFQKQPYVLGMSMRSSCKMHFRRLTRAHQSVVRRWLDRIRIPIGSFDSKGNVKEPGVTTSDIDRRTANLLFFEEFRKSLHPWPWESQRTE